MSLSPRGREAGYGSTVCEYVVFVGLIEIGNVWLGSMSPPRLRRGWACSAVRVVSKTWWCLAMIIYPAGCRYRPIDGARLSITLGFFGHNLCASIICLPAMCQKYRCGSTAKEAMTRLMLMFEVSIGLRELFASLPYFMSIAGL